MGSFVNALETGILDHITGGTGGTVYVPEAANLWVALWVGDPTDTGSGGAEASYTNYARQQIDFDVAVLADRKVVQNGLLTFPTCGASGQSGVTHFVIYDLVAGTEQIGHGALNSTKNVTTGNAPTVADGEIEISINTGAWSNYLVKAVLDWVFCQGTFTTPAHYVCLADTAMSDTTTGTSVSEIGMTDYARELITAGDFDAATSGDPSYTANGSLIDFGTLTSTAETIEAIGVVDAASNGNMLFWDNTISQEIEDGSTVQISVGDLDLTFA